MIAGNFLPQCQENPETRSDSIATYKQAVGMEQDDLTTRQKMPDLLNYEHFKHSPDCFAG